MRRWTAFGMMFVVFMFGLNLVVPVGQAADAAKELAAKYILATAKAARTVYVKGVVADAGKGGLKPSEDWAKDDHGIMLPAQFVKELGKEIKEFELSLVGTDPLYASNSAKSDKENEMLAELAKGKEKLLVAQDGGVTVGMSADYAIVDGCADCHNKHPKTTKKDWKKGDFMGAIVVRLP
jgi:adenylate cyclase